MYPILAGAGKKKKAESAPHVSIGCMITLAAALDVDYSFGNHDLDLSVSFLLFQILSLGGNRSG